MIESRKMQPMTGRDITRNYRAMYRAACNFHERHNPPRIDADDDGGRYWQEVNDDMIETAASFKNDAFLCGLLLAIFDELEREYNGIKAK